jgi:hypothetical protein
MKFNNLWHSRVLQALGTLLAQEMELMLFPWRVLISA